MNYGFYLSAAGVLTSMYRQDVVANNLANLNTPGFKPDEVYTRQRLPARLERADAAADPQQLLEHLGGGVLVDPTYINLRQGNLARTGAPLDVAIRGEGFLVLSTGRGSGNEHLRLTRDGRLTLNASGELVTAAGGLRVLNTSNQPIRLDRAAEIRIAPTGDISQNGTVVGRIQVTAPPPPNQLAKAGNTELRFNAAAAASRRPSSAALAQGYLESSAVDPILALNTMINAAKSVQANAKMMQYHDHLMGQAINTFGRVA
jgi:flagellar basal body rod protein FlgG